MAASDPVTFLRSIAPFDRLPQPLFEDATRSLEVGFLAAGTPLVRAGGEPLRHLYVIRRGAVRLERDHQTLEVLEEGEAFGYTSLITRQATLDVTVEEDLLVYRLPADAFERLLGDAHFASHFAVGLAARLRSSLESSPVATFEADLSQEVGQLLRRGPVWIDEDATVADAARLMRSEGISSVLVRGNPPGIVTDRDFRTRVLAEGRGPATPVREVASRPLRSIGAATPIFEAWNTLFDAGVHHLAVERDGATAGVLTSSDLLRCSAQGPVSVLRNVERLAGRESLPGYAGRVAEMTSALLAGGLEADTIAGFVARLNDALLRRILAWAEADLGAAPAPYAWLVFGSEGRMEQTLLTDQDNALAYDDAGEPHRAWYQVFAERVNADLEAAGFPPCPGGRMARRWHQSASAWGREITECIEQRPQAAGIFFDSRIVGGSLDPSPIDRAMKRAHDARLFVRALARGALDLSPRRMLLLRESSRVDLKREGISPVVHLARCYAIEGGVSARNTLDRLDAAVAAGLMGEAVHADASEAYRFLRGLLLRTQLRAMLERRPVTTEVIFSDLSPLERNRLRASFRAIRAWQEKAAYRYQTGLL